MKMTCIAGAYDNNEKLVYTKEAKNDLTFFCLNMASRLLLVSRFHLMTKMAKKIWLKKVVKIHKQMDDALLKVFICC